jgi:hypothetical protein
MKPILVLIAVIVVFAGCQKQAIPKPVSNQNDLVASAQTYYNTNLQSLPLSSSNLRTKTSKIPIWNNASVIQLSIGQAVLVPLQYNKKLYLNPPQATALLDINQIAQLLMYKDSSSGSMHTEIITSFPDSNYLNRMAGNFSGIILVEDWAGNPIKKLKYDPEGVEISSPLKSGRGTISMDAITTTSIIETCFVISGYNYSPDDPGASYSWTESGGCDYSIDEKSDGGGGGGASAGDYGGVGARNKPTPLTINVFVGKNPITNIQQWIKCFTSSSSPDHTYTVTVCVEQPDPGSRTPWTLSGTGTVELGNWVDVGHTFLVFNETYGGNSTIRNIGFYPSTTVYPGPHSTTQGMLNDDALHSYNVAATYQLNNTQFFQILNYAALGNNTGFSYDLSSNNCTTFGIRAMAAGGVTLPSTIGSWAGESGNDPGDLGQDLLLMGSSPGVSVSTAQGTHPDIGWCD